MTERKSAGEYTPAAQRSIDADPDSYETSTDGTASIPSSDWLFGYTFSSPKTFGQVAISDGRVTAVYDVLADWLAAHPMRSSVTSADLVDECEYNRSTIGRALGALAEDDACPIALTRWSAENNRGRWTVRRVTAGDSDE